MTGFCRDYLKCSDIPVCVGAIVIGTIANLSASLYAVFRNETTGRITTIPCNSNGSGVVTVDVSDVTFSINASYFVSIVSTASNLNNPITINIGSESANEVQVSFEEIKDENNDPMGFPSITLTVA